MFAQKTRIPHTKNMNPVTSAEVSGKNVIVRADLDLAERNGQLETFRLDRLIPTLRDLLSRGASVRIIAHRGRPNGIPNPALSTAPFAPLLSERLGEEVRFAGDITSSPSGKISLFENLRFSPGEENNSQDFVEALLGLGEIYVNESFASAHRSHASVTSLPKYLPHFAGLNLMAEVENLTKILERPERPLVVIIGGSKVETKRPLIERMQTLADAVLIGGSLVNEGLQPMEKVILPLDNISGKDIGTQTQELFKKWINSAKTIVWNGPMGIYEDPAFAAGSVAVARAVSASPAFTVVGGGETIACLNELGLLPQIKFVSTGGGAMLEFLSGKPLPGLEALG